MGIPNGGPMLKSVDLPCGRRVLDIDVILEGLDGLLKLVVQQSFALPQSVFGQLNTAQQSLVACADLRELVLDFGMITLSLRDGDAVGAKCLGFALELNVPIESQLLPGALGRQLAVAFLRNIVVDHGLEIGRCSLLDLPFDTCRPASAVFPSGDLDERGSDVDLVAIIMY